MPQVRAMPEHGGGMGIDLERDDEKISSRRRFPEHLAEGRPQNLADLLQAGDGRRGAVAFHLGNEAGGVAALVRQLTQGKASALAQFADTGT